MKQFEESVKKFASGEINFDKMKLEIGRIDSQMALMNKDQHSKALMQIGEIINNLGTVDSNDYSRFIITVSDMVFTHKKALVG